MMYDIAEENPEYDAYCIAHGLKMANLSSTTFAAGWKSLVASSQSKSAVPNIHRDLASSARSPEPVGLARQNESLAEDCGLNREALLSARHMHQRIILEMCPV